MDQWLTDTFSTPDAATMLSIVAKSAAIYLLVVSAMRLLGTPEIGQVTTYDFVLIVVVANAVQNSMTKGDRRLAGAIASAGALLALGALMGFLSTRLPDVETRLAGSPTVLVRNGSIVRGSLRQARISDEELMAQVRNNGLAAIDDVALVVLEMDGSISVVPRRDDDDYGSSSAG